MKRIIAIASIILLFVFHCNSQSGWFWQNPLPQGNHLFDVKFVNENTGYAAGDFGTLIKTTDAGLTWHILAANSSYDMISICFTSLSTGYVLGRVSDLSLSVIIKTTNGGLGWNQVTSLNRKFNSFYFTGNMTGYAVGDSAAIYKTTNGGHDWLSIQNSLYENLNAVFFTNPDTGYISSVYIYKTTNCGLNWFMSYPGSWYNYKPTLYTIYFPNANTGYAAGDNGRIIRTTNAGNSWDSLSNYYGNVFTSIFFANGNRGYAVGSWITRTTNGGNNWLSMNIPFCCYQNSVCLTDTITGYMVGEHGGIAKTTNGINWNTFSNGTTWPLYSIHFPVMNTGYAAGDFGTIVKTTNSGNNWITLMSDSSDLDLASVFFPDVYTGYIGGSSMYNGIAKILKTTNGGINWDERLFLEGSRFRKIFFLDPVTGYAVGSSINSAGLIIKTTDGGSNWNTLSLESSDELSSVFFNNAYTGYTSGNMVYKTTNGGLNWYEAAPNLSFLSIYFTDLNTGYGAGYEGIYKTTNEGVNWILVLTGITASYNSVHFIDMNTGWATGFIYPIGSVVYKTTNGGLNWYRQSCPTNYSLYSVHFTSANTGYVVGEGGTILKTTDGGGPLINVKISSQNISDRFRLRQNYPNPFNPATRIKFDIAESGDVKLIIYDVLGREVATLVNEQLKPGVYEVEWNALNYPSGVYFYQLKTDEFQEAKRMVLVK